MKIIVPVLCGLVLMAGCAKEEHRLIDTKEPFPSYREKVIVALKQEDRLHAVAALKDMIRAYPEHPDIPAYQLTLADLHFDHGKRVYDNDELQSALELYERFTRFNPSDVRSEYASYRRILSAFYQTQSVECDTASLAAALEMCDEHLMRHDFKSGEYAQDVEDIRKTCQQRLVDKEVYIFNTYLGKDDYQSAENRIAALEQFHLPQNAELAPRIGLLKFKLALSKKDQENTASYLEWLKSEYPESEYTQVALATYAKSQSPTRFF